MSNFDYDLIIVGGGIHGTGIAQAAAVAGYRVLLLEQHALASGTSSRSSKLIHGGLRYLETAQFSLVRECLHERHLLLKNAPDLVHLMPFYIPVYKQTSRRPWQLRTGLSLYGLLTGLDRSALFRSIPKKEWDTLDGLDTRGLQKVYQYYDAQTDDARLTRAVMQSACEHGAELAMPATLEQATLFNKGADVHFTENGRAQNKRCRVLVNAAGPWANHVLDNISPRQTQVGIDLVQGTHIILKGKLDKGCYYLEAAQDRRAVFALPWYGKTMVGTTETLFTGNPADVAPLAEEKDYLLSVFGQYFPSRHHCRQSDIIDAFAGLRVLPRQPGSAFSRPRETIFHTDRQQSPRLLTLYGGKLTAYRATAEHVMATLRSALPPATKAGNTRNLPLRPAN